MKKSQRPCSKDLYIISHRSISGRMEAIHMLFDQYSEDGGGITLSFSISHLINKKLYGELLANTVLKISVCRE